MLSNTKFSKRGVPCPLLFWASISAEIWGKISRRANFRLTDCAWNKLGARAAKGGF
jgi:hypothetical protein